MEIDRNINVRIPSEKVVKAFIDRNDTKMEQALISLDNRFADLGTKDQTLPVVT